MVGVRVRVRLRLRVTCTASSSSIMHRLHVELKSYTYYLSLTIAGGVEKRGDRSRGESHPALAAAGAG
eukprot:scaffold116590_cov69-Phaeocystis_antarctica.AAC.1